ncbi:MAG: enoyl-CoA hydratase/isomerase family protein [Caulobacteraceae bacterium]|nr:enoyl-CoA hydratase/isomerase family protein [Caulobacteraceae bacterium]
MPADLSPAAESALRELEDAGALGLAVTEAAAGRLPAPVPGASGIVQTAVHRRGPIPTEGLEPFDVLLSADPQAPRPWVGAPAEGLDAAFARLEKAAARQPVAAAVAAQVLRMSLSLTFEQALALESLAYSMLLASEGFKAWRAANPPRRRPAELAPRVRVERQGDVLSIRLTRAAARNAVDARMRDALAEALEFARIDPELAPVVLSGEGPAFSAGGDLDEFGQADDPGRAHAIRTLRSATGCVAAIAGRVTARLHGACVGAGVEIPAAAGRVLVRADTICRLPEVAMGLIPGAGGTASIPRRIGRQRACYMAIAGAEVDAETALGWGLADALDEGP